jgi:hypothetical protein
MDVLFTLMVFGSILQKILHRPAAKIVMCSSKKRFVLVIAGIGPVEWRNQRITGACRCAEPP